MLFLAFTIPSLSETLVFLFAAAVPVAFTVGLIRFAKKRANEDLDAHPKVVQAVTPEEH